MPDAQARDIVEPTEEMVELGAKACRHVTFNALTMDECRDAVRAALTAALTRDPHQPRRMKPMNGKHTPGRWHWWTSCSWRRLKSDLGGGNTANVLEPTKHPYDGHPDIIVSEADMALIAAAPEMFEALSKALAAWSLEKSEPGHDLMGIEQEMRAALSKATGEQ